ncbi:MAG: S-methyl-5-thioribose-1-phosphate isomerase [Elusimicrobia bacterium RIFOXYD2_FULL_34_15]|nr:MAG: S-methyl-5-thioribose-1-phosphate isomerase [Elusimicrobia bacterium RIFOXYD2_FULL_34_15]
MIARTLYLDKDILKILDQRLLPSTVFYIDCKTKEDTFDCIKDMAIRGAPAIGVAAGYGMYLASCEKEFNNISEMKKYLDKAGKYLISARPTAVNLFWGVNRILNVVKKYIGSNIIELKLRIREEANKIYNEDIEINKKIGENGAKLFNKKSTILTHCNAGALATAGWGTALGVIRSAYNQNKVKMVYVDETRPYLQGARLTAWELLQEKIPCVLITDNMAGHFISKGEIDAVVVGADRIASNGDTANKIGTYSLAVLCNYNKIPFYIAAPVSTFDIKISDGKKIKIEFRSSDEVVLINKKHVAPVNMKALHPAFDVTPHELITAIITEKGVIKKPSVKTIRAILGKRVARH